MTTTEEARHILRQEYWNKVKQAVELIVEDCKTGNYELEELLDDWAESNTTYTSDALQVLCWTENDDAIKDAFGNDPAEWDARNVADLYQKIAFFAFREDVRSRLPEDLEDEEE